MSMKIPPGYVVGCAYHGKYYWEYDGDGRGQFETLNQALDSANDHYFAQQQLHVMGRGGVLDKAIRQATIKAMGCCAEIAENEASSMRLNASKHPPGSAFYIRFDGMAQTAETIANTIRDAIRFKRSGKD